MPVLADLLDALRTGRVEIVDLTAPLHSGTPVIKLPPPFANAAPFALTERSRFDERGPAWYWNAFSAGELVDFRQRGLKIFGNVIPQRLERRNVECVDAATLFLGIGLGQFHQAGQEPSKGLAAAGGCDQHRRAPVPDRPEHRQLMVMHLPAAALEPGGEAGRQQAGGDNLVQLSLWRSLRNKTGSS